MEPTKPSEIIRQVKLAIADNRIVEACDFLQSTILEKEALALKGRLKDLERRNSRGILDTKEYDVAKSKIRNGLLNLLDQLDNPGAEVREESRRLPVWVYILLVIAFLGIINNWSLLSRIFNNALNDNEKVGSNKELEVSAEFFNLTIFVHGSEGLQDIILEGQGYLIIDLNDDRRKATIGANGKTVFSDIPQEFDRQKITVGLQADGFVFVHPGKEYLIGDSPIYIELKENNYKVNPEPIAKKETNRSAEMNSCKIFGIVIDNFSDSSIAGVEVFIICDNIFRTKTDKNGYFSLEVPQKLKGDQCIIRVEGNAIFRPKETYIPMCDLNQVELRLDRK